MSHFTRPQLSYKIKDVDVGGVYVVNKRELKNEYHSSVGISKENLVYRQTEDKHEKESSKDRYDSVDCNIVVTLKKHPIGTTADTNMINVIFLTLAAFLFSLPHSE
jgi:hypothetical protein